MAETSFAGEKGLDPTSLCTAVDLWPITKEWTSIRLP